MHKRTLTPSHTLGLTSCSMCDRAGWLETDIPLPRGSALSHRKLECELGHTRRGEKMGEQPQRLNSPPTGTTLWRDRISRQTVYLCLFRWFSFFFVCNSSNLNDDCRKTDAQENINTSVTSKKTIGFLEDNAMQRWFSVRATCAES